LQVLYELDCTTHNLDSVFSQRTDEVPLDGALAEFAWKLVTGAREHRRSMDALIQQHAPEWPFDQMAIIDRNILRMAIYEFAVDDSTPTKVAINEAVELAKMYGSESAPRFVNGVLGALAAKENDIRQTLAAAPDE
ncbi:MAG: transcription antitermination factor NusB, partial [Anaerolineales bacterium]